MSKFKKVAYIDGYGKYAEVHLFEEDKSTGEVTELPWPSNWPNWVSVSFLRGNGFDIAN